MQKKLNGLLSELQVHEYAYNYTLAYAVERALIVP